MILEEPTAAQRAATEQLIELTQQLAARTGASLQVLVNMTASPLDGAPSTKLECSDGKNVHFTVIDRSTARALNSPFALIASTSVIVDDE